MLIVLITALATATFIENDFGAEVAKMKVYNTRWVELIFILLCINLIGRALILKLYKVQKFSIFLFHIALIVMIIGAGVTRYFGYEGNMHIREGETSSLLITSKKTVSVFTNQTQPNEFAVDFNQTNKFTERVKDGNHHISISLAKKYNSAYAKAVEDETGNPIVGFILAGNRYRGFEYLSEGESKQIGDVTIGFTNTSLNDLNIVSENDSLFLISKDTITVNSMVNGSELVKLCGKFPLEYKAIYQVKAYNFVLQEFHPKAKIVAVPTDVAKHMQGRKAFLFNVADDQNSTQVTIWEGSNQVVWTNLGNQKIGLSYGNKTINLPFSIQLDDFVIERYPGSMSPSSFSSYVTLIENGTEARPFHIYMNNILKHHGYRFYQSSYDEDERGTILSVNNDKWGTMITYIGYFLLALGILWSMINSNSFFRKTVIRTTKASVLALLLIAGSHQISYAQGQNTSEILAPINQKHAEEFGKLLIQNNKGRTEPVYTYASELMRKISRKEKMLGLNPVQLFMEMNMNPQRWINEPIIQINNIELQEHLGIKGKYGAYSDFISNQSGYKLQKMVEMVYAKSPSERSKFDKAIMKTDEKVNICYAIFSGRYLKIFPLPNSTEHTWYTAKDASLLAGNEEDSLFLAHIMPTYFEEVNKARGTGNYAVANEFLDGLITYQQKNAAYSLPSNGKTSIEIMYYKYNPFKKLFPFYATLGVIFLFILIIFIVIGKDVPKWTNFSFVSIVFIAFIIHTLGIAGRWYISGHAPMSNGYESMIFISWVTILAGFLFSKRSPFALPATVAIGGLTLMVANLSFMDPEITNLVPVLQSYWLTIHVSVITASYGFLALGALIGIINLVLILLRNTKNHSRIIATLESLTILNHKTLIVGLYLLTIGTFLGAVWANESWGRYWGWDPKETWALISILVYTIVTHARLIPGMKGIFTFNTLALVGFSSILMTYFGVNYYLSGLHSYAAGDPVPVPTFVYYTVAAVLVLILGASMKYKKMASNELEE